MGYQFIENVSTQEHDEFVCNHALCNLLQSSKWGEVKGNWQRRIVGVKDYDKMVASSMILVKQLPMKVTIFYIPRGPVMDYDNTSLVHFYLDSIRLFAKKHRCLYITFDPAIQRNAYVLEEATDAHDRHIDKLLDTLSSCGAKFKGFSKHIEDSIQPRFHANVYLSDNIEEGFRKSAKKALASAKKKKVQVEAVGVGGIDAFSRIMQCTEERKKIHLRDQSYFKKILDIYGEDAVIYLAKLPIKELYEEIKEKLDKCTMDIEECPANAKKKRFTLEELHTSLMREEQELKERLVSDGDVVVISGALCVCYGSTAEILYAGMDERYKRYMAAYASFYSCMKWSFEHGCTWCNMGGVEGDLKGGLIHFKANFNPVIHEYIGEFDLPVYKPLYPVVQLLLKARKKLIQMKAR